MGGQLIMAYQATKLTIGASINVAQLRQWALLSCGHYSIIVPAQSWSLHSHGHCSVMVTAQSWSLLSQGQ